MIRTALCLFLLGLLPLCAQVLMVRCDDGGDKEFLSSPDSINLSSLQSGFDPNVDSVVMVHGFLNDFDDCKGSYTATMNTLKPIIGKRNYVGFHWPSKVLWFGTGVENANKSGEYLVHVLVNMSRWYGTSNRKIHLMTHSLGGRVLLNTLSTNQARYVKWGTCYTMASAVHNDSFQTTFPGTNEIPQKIYVFHSNRDYVLKYIYSLYYWLFGRGGFDYPEAEAWMQMPVTEQLEYLQRLDEQMQRGETVRSEFDQFLCDLMVEASKQAMGLEGSQPTYKVENVNVSDVVDSHTYWENTAVIERIAHKF